MSTVLTGTAHQRVVPSPLTDSSLLLNPGNQSNDREKSTEADIKSLDRDTASLGVPKQEKRFWFQRDRTYDPSAIATQVLMCLYKLYAPTL
jgi:hypothetical protein